MPEEKQAVIFIRLKPEHKRELEKISRKKGESLTTVVRSLIRTHIEHETKTAVT